MIQLVRVLLVDDQPLVRTGLRRILAPEEGFDVVGECADGSEVAAAVASTRPDVVLMDVRMPRMSQGLSNEEIANDLVIGEATVKTHISRIFDKLEVRDRAAAIVFAFEEGLVAPGMASGGRRGSAPREDLV